MKQLPPHNFAEYFQISIEVITKYSPADINKTISQARGVQ